MILPVTPIEPMSRLKVPVRKQAFQVKLVIPKVETPTDLSTCSYIPSDLTTKAPNAPEPLDIESLRAQAAASFGDLEALNMVYVGHAYLQLALLKKTYGEAYGKLPSQPS